MAAAVIRKIVTLVDETRREMEREVVPPRRKCAAMAVVRNPCAGKFVQDLQALVDIGDELGAGLTLCALAALQVEPGQIHGYGKAAIVGENGELEHAAAVLHVRLGKTMWPVLGQARALIPATKRVGGPGAGITVPLGHKDDAWDPAHWDALHVSVPDAPRADELVVVVVLTDGGRPLYRVGDHRPAVARETG